VGEKPDWGNAGMMRLGVSVEGPTEREFVIRVLKPHLLKHGWEVIKPVSLNGGVSLRRFVEEIRCLSPQFEWVTTLYDLYKFEGREGRDADKLEQAMQTEAGAMFNLLPYVQQYEFEALVFSDPKKLTEEFQAPKALGDLNKILTECGSPENINHGYQTIPSRRLQRIFPKYDKVVHGAQIAGKIGLACITAHCPRFATWLSKLEEIGSRNPHKT
jgi:hypothetical protein